MRVSAPIPEWNPQLREAFDEACLAVFHVRVPPPSAMRTPHVHLWPLFATQYRHLSAMPRRVRRALERRCKCTLAAIALLMTLGQGPAWAANITVSPGTPPSVSSDGKCSLIEAIVNANRDARTHLDCVAGQGADVIILPELSQQRLKPWERLPAISSRIVIEGQESTIRRDTLEPSRLTFFRVTAAGDFTLRQATVSGATANGVSGGYGGINNAGILELDRSSIQGTHGRPGLVNSGTATLQDSSVAGNGFSGPRMYGYGGISNRGTLVLRNSAVTGNGAAFSGAGISNGAGSTLTLIDSVVAENVITYEGHGGGISNNGRMVLIRSTVSGNRADFGGGIHNSGTGTATLTRCTISGNSAHNVYRYGTGGGIDNWGTLSITNSTVSGNAADYGAGLNHSASERALTVSSSTVTGNTARYEGGGLFVQSGTLRLKRSTVSGNAATRGNEINNEPLYFHSDGVVLADDFNLFGHGGDAGVLGFTLGSTDIVPNEHVDAILMPLADNGGGTHTHALAMGSPALDASPDDAACPAIDQRGNPRPRGPACDVGSFEGSAVLCSGRVTTMVGTDGPDDLTGTPGPDVISGLNGNDAIGGLGGNDVICGGGGADSLYGGAGNDALFGQGGNDRLFGHRGNDTLHGGTGQDQCDGGLHSDTAVACETVRNVP